MLHTTGSTRTSRPRGSAGSEGRRGRFPRGHGRPGAGARAAGGVRSARCPATCTQRRGFAARAPASPPAPHLRIPQVFKFTENTFSVTVTHNSPSQKKVIQKRKIIQFLFPFRSRRVSASLPVSSSFSPRPFPHLWSAPLSLSLLLFALLSFLFLPLAFSLLPPLLPHPHPPPRLSSLSGAPVLPSVPPQRRVSRSSRGSRPPLLPCPPTVRGSSSHLPIKAKCMLPAAGAEHFPGPLLREPRASPGPYVLKVR